MVALLFGQQFPLTQSLISIFAELLEKERRRSDHPAAGAGQTNQRPASGHQAVARARGNRQPAQLRLVLVALCVSSPSDPDFLAVDFLHV